MLCITHLCIILTLCQYGLTHTDGSHYTNVWIADFKSDLTDSEVNSIAHHHGFINYGKIFPDMNLYQFHHLGVEKKALHESTKHTKLLQSHHLIRSAEQQIANIRVKRSQTPETDITVIDPLWSQTWYLNRGIGSENDYDMNVIAAWSKGFTGKGVVVTILDDGIERTHPDLTQNFDAGASTDINDHDDDPMPKYDYTNENKHGTRCAGEVAATLNNSVCSVGVAYNANIGGIRMLDGSVTDVVESTSLSFNPNHIDIYSSSWGPDDNGRTVDGPGPLVKKAFVDGVEKGRNGKGSIFVWASGNGGSHSDSCACDGYANSIYTVSVSSVTEHNSPPWYLEECASTLAATYSSGIPGSDKQIVTTDLRNSCTSSHTGTSASAPLAAGLIAVMLEANSYMTWRDVQYVTLESANPEPLLYHGDFRTNGANRSYSHKFGYGLMDCGKMTDLAVTWRKVPPQLIKRYSKESPRRSLDAPYTQKVNVTECSQDDNGCIRHLEHVQLVLTMNSAARGGLMVKLTSPSGTESTVLPPRNSDRTAGSFTDWPFLSLHFWGEDPAGLWQFKIDNDGQPGTISSYQLILHGVSVDPYNMDRHPSTDHLTCDQSCGGNGTEFCFGSGHDQCKRCQPGLVKVSDTHICVESCNDGYYQDGTECKTCHSSCGNCSWAKSNHCISCAGDLLLDDLSQCIKYCPSHYIVDEQNKRCKPDDNQLNNKEKAKYSGTIAAGVVIPIIAIALIIAVVLICMRKRKLEARVKYSHTRNNDGSVWIVEQT